MVKPDRRAVVAVRRYQSNDTDSCRGLWAELVDWHRRIYDDLGIGGSDPARHFDAHLQRVGPEHIWIAEVSGRVVGMAGLVLGKPEAELEPLIVSERYRALGVGRGLVEEVIEAARSAGVRLLKVQPVARNDSAIRFFHERGFDVLGQMELLMDLSPQASQKWKDGGRIAGKRFKL